MKMPKCWVSFHTLGGGKTPKEKGPSRKETLGGRERSGMYPNAWGWGTIIVFRGEGGLGDLKVWRYWNNPTSLIGRSQVGKRAVEE